MMVEVEDCRNELAAKIVELAVVKDALQEAEKSSATAASSSAASPGGSLGVGALFPPQCKNTRGKSSPQQQLFPSASASATETKTKRQTKKGRERETSGARDETKETAHAHSDPPPAQTGSSAWI